MDTGSAAPSPSASRRSVSFLPDGVRPVSSTSRGANFNKLTQITNARRFSRRLSNRVGRAESVEDQLKKIQARKAQRIAGNRQITNAYKKTADTTRLISGLNDTCPQSARLNRYKECKGPAEVQRLSRPPPEVLALQSSKTPLSLDAAAAAALAVAALSGNVRSRQGMPSTAWAAKEQADANAGPSKSISVVGSPSVMDALTSTSFSSAAIVNDITGERMAKIDRAVSSKRGSLVPSSSKVEASSSRLAMTKDKAIALKMSARSSLLELPSTAVFREELDRGKEQDEATPVAAPDKAEKQKTAAEGLGSTSSKGKHGAINETRPWECRWLFLTGLSPAATAPGPPEPRFLNRREIAGMQTEAQGDFAVLVATKVCPPEAPPRRVICGFDPISGRGPNGVLIEFSSVEKAKKALQAFREASRGPQRLWTHVDFAKEPGNYTAALKG
eukprot:TRINITY_DN8381_c1_g4_i1.p1 TRINITY_DN8381_c1_g4~~TRINITY_DN8381_c1_g4_i1.p1  ORF type:complete len:445 (-),score=90.30 TRINITY_DN8381_c1_g4_i1:71-1405(-)